MRHAAALIACLPRGSLTLAKIEPSAQWTDIEYLLLTIANAWREEPINPPWEEQSNSNGGIRLDVDEYAKRLNAPRKEVVSNGKH